MKLQQIYYYNKLIPIILQSIIMKKYKTIIYYNEYNVAITWPKLFLSIICIAIYCNKICEIIVYCYKIFEVVNCLLQQQIYYYIKIVIKIFKVYCNEIFLILRDNFVLNSSLFPLQ